MWNSGTEVFTFGMGRKTGRNYFNRFIVTKSQLTEKGVEEWINAEMKDPSFTTYFRQLMVDTTVRTGF